MSYAIVAQVSVGSSTNGTVTTGNIDTTGANLIVLNLSNYEPRTIPTISDSKGNTYTQLTSHFVSNDGRQTLFYCFNPSVGSGHNFTATDPGSGSFPTINVAAFSGATSSPLDQQSGTTTTGTSIQPGSLTPSESNCLVVVGLNFGATNTIAINGGFTIANQVQYSAGLHFGGALAYLIQTSAAAANPTLSWSSSNAAMVGMAVFKDTPSAGAVVKQLAALGAG